MSDVAEAPPPAPAPRDGTAPVYPLTPDQFRALFTAFADATAYPDTTIQMWLDLGGSFVNCDWGPAQAWGQGLWAAHEMAKLATAAAQAPGNMSGIGGIVNSRSVGPVSVSYDTELGTVDNAGAYNLTIYGRQYFQLSLIFGQGPYQIGPPEWPPVGVGIAWPGPFPYLGFDQ